MKEQQRKKTAREIIDGFVGYVKQLVEDLDESGSSLDEILGGFSGRYPVFNNQVMLAVANRRNAREATLLKVIAPPVDIIKPEPQVKQRVPRRFFATQPL